MLDSDAINDVIKEASTGNPSPEKAPADNAAISLNAKSMNETISDAVIALSRMWLNHPAAKNNLALANAVTAGIATGLGRVLKDLPTHQNKDFMNGTIDGIALVLRTEAGVMSTDELVSTIMTQLSGVDATALLDRFNVHRGGI